MAMPASCAATIPISLFVKFRELPSRFEAKSGSEDIENLINYAYSCAALADRRA
jgi:hypothetical protein